MLQRFLAWAFPEYGRWSRLVLLSLLIGFWIAMIILPSGWDLPVYILPALRGESVDYPYPPWSFWFLQPLLWLPFKANYGVLVGIIIATLVLARRLLRPNAWLLFLSLPFVWVLWYGQFETFVSVGAVLAWVALQRRQSVWVGIGMALMSVKPQIGFPAALAVLWWLPTWKQRLFAAAIPGGLILTSLAVVGPDWFFVWLGKLSFWLDYYTNGSLYWWVGPWAYLLYLPALLLPLERLQRYRLILATTLLTSPFVPNYSQLVLYLFPLAWYHWLLGFLPLLQIWGGEGVHRFTFLMPLSVTLGIYVLAWRKRHPQAETHHDADA